MGKAIVVANQKGGVGKTTTVVNLASALTKLNKKVLVIDMDPQGNATSGLGIDKNEERNTVYDVLLNQSGIEEAVCKDVFPRLSVVPAGIDLAAAEIELVGVDRKEFILRQAIAKCKSKYDFILIDCPPSLNILTINSMCAADSILVPIQCEYYALEGLSQLLHTIDLVTDRMNSELEVEGIVFTMFDGRTNLSQQVVENVRNNLHLRMFKSVIPRNVRLAEAPSYGLPILEYDVRSNGAAAYVKLANELIKANRKHR